MSHVWPNLWIPLLNFASASKTFLIFACWCHHQRCWTGLNSLTRVTCLWLDINIMMTKRFWLWRRHIGTEKINKKDLALFKQCVTVLTNTIFHACFSEGFSSLVVCWLGCWFLNIHSFLLWQLYKIWKIATVSIWTQIYIGQRTYNKS
jgi:hypothetical protein